jgi:hypothetical protein
MTLYRAGEPVPWVKVEPNHSDRPMVVGKIVFSRDVEAVERGEDLLLCALEPVPGPHIEVRDCTNCHITFTRPIKMLDYDGNLVAEL